MPVLDPLILPSPTRGQITDTREDGTRLCMTVSWLDRYFHLTLVRATETPCDVDGDIVPSIDDPKFDHSELRADDLEDESELETLWNLHDAYFETVRVPGFEGEYVAFLTPFDR